MDEITVIMNGYKRPQHFNEQLYAIENQTIKPKDIMLWQNSGAVFNNVPSYIKHSNNTFNYGVWSRFAFALNAKTKYVCIFDDDTIPGNRWFENCLNTIKTHNGLLGTIGVIFDNGSQYLPNVRIGWAVPNEETIKVDIVGHSWFFEREWLSHFWRELPDIDSNSLVGEDIHFSAMLQRFADKDTFVPPHPKEDRSLWGSIPETAWSIGQDSAAISMNMNNLNAMNIALNNEISKGFKTIH